MNVNNDWERWAAVWQAQPPADLQRLRRGARHKLWRMGAFVAAELLASAIAVSQVVRLMMHPGLEWRWKVWAAMMLGFVLIMQYLFLRIRHGAWRSLGNDSTEFLRLEVRRAEAGIRLAKLNAWSLLLWVVVTLVVAAPELMPARWRSASLPRQSGSPTYPDAARQRRVIDHDCT